MERRDWSLEALRKLRYVDSLDEVERAAGLERWAKQYFNSNNDELELELERDEYKELSELFFKNIQFLKKFNTTIQKELSQIRKMRTFLQNS